MRGLLAAPLIGSVKVIQRTPAEAWGTMWRLALRVPPARWLLGALWMPGTPARATVTALPEAAWTEGPR